jgi:chromosome segregation ATPase
MSALRTELELLRKDYLEVITSLKEEIKDAYWVIVHLRNENTYWQTKLHSTESELEQLKSQLHGTESELKRLKNKLEGTKSELEELNGTELEFKP